MERRVNQKIEKYITQMKDEVCKKVQDLAVENKDQAADLLSFIYDYSRLNLSKEDILPKKRPKTTVPDNSRCIARRANGEQCTRRKKDSCDFCGTHTKGVPHGRMELTVNESENVVRTIDLFAQDIRGIIHYLDHDGNVYRTEDILNDNLNPAIVGTYECSESGGYRVMFNRDASADEILKCCATAEDCADAVMDANAVVDADLSPPPFVVGV